MINTERIKDVLCANPLYDPSWWSVDGNVLTEQNLIAMQLCTGCPVLVQCCKKRDANPRLYQGLIMGAEVVPTSSALSKRKQAARRRSAVADE